jgi:hypothetical protein
MKLDCFLDGIFNGHILHSANILPPGEGRASRLLYASNIIDWDLVGHPKNYLE